MLRSESMANQELTEQVQKMEREVNLARQERDKCQKLMQE